MAFELQPASLPPYPSSVLQRLYPVVKMGAPSHPSSQSGATVSPQRGRVMVFPSAPPHVAEVALQSDTAKETKYSFPHPAPTSSVETTPHGAGLEC